MTGSRCLINLIFCGWLFVAAVGNGQAQTTAVQVEKDREVLLTLTVSNDQGLPIKGLKPEHFKISGDKKLREITSFSDRDEPISVAFLLDTSGSMKGSDKDGNDLRFFINGITSFIENGNQTNEYAILSFSDEVRLAQDWTQNKRVIEQSLAGVVLQPAKGHTVLYDACRQGVDLMRHSKHRKRVVLLLSDGMENGSKDARFGKVKEQLRSGDTIFYSIAIARLGHGYPVDAQGQAILEEVTELTGGISLFPQTPIGLEASFEVIGRYLRNQYVIGFKIDESTAGKWHPVKVEIKLPPDVPRELKSPVVRHRAGYFDRVEQP